MGDFLWRQTFPANLAQNSSLSAVSWAPDRWDVFGTYADGTLQHWWFENGNTGFDPVIASGLIPAGGLCAMALEPERLDVFGVGAPLGAQLGDLQHVWYPPPPGNEQFGQESLSGKLAVLAEANYAQPWGGPSAVLLAGPGPSESILQIFAISSGGELLRWTLGEPSQPETIIPPLKQLAALGGLSAVSWGDDRIDVFAAATDGTLQHWWADGPLWDPQPGQWEDLGGALWFSPPSPAGQPSGPSVASPLCAVSWAPDRLDVFGVGPGQNQPLQHFWYPPNLGEQGPFGQESLGGQVTAAPLVANTRWAFGTLDVFAPGLRPDNTPMLQWWWYRSDPAPDPGWNNGSSMPRAFADPWAIGPPVACVSRTPNALDVFSCDANGDLVWYEYF